MQYFLQIHITKFIDYQTFAELCENLCGTLREIDNQIFHAKFRKEV